MSDTTVPEPLEAKKFQCDICKKIYRKRYFLLDHARKVHGGKIMDFFKEFFLDSFLCEIDFFQIRHSNGSIARTVAKNLVRQRPTKGTNSFNIPKSSLVKCVRKFSLMKPFTKGISYDFTKKRI